MINSGVNAIKDLQVGLAESRLYNGRIDGVWGQGSTDAVNLLLTTAAQKRGVSGSVGGLVPSSAPDQILTNIQTALTALGLYKGRADGLYGDGTSLAFYTINKEYRQDKGLPEWDLCWSKRVSTDFTQAVKNWADSRGLGWIGAHCAMGCMGFESAGTFRPDIQNMAGAQAFGLLQFMRPAASDLGTTVEALAAMSQMDQLQYVFKYFDMRQKQYGIFKRLDDFYLSVFYPKAIGHAPNEKIFEKGTKGYTQNSGLDINRDGVITIAEISARIYASYYEGMQLINRNVKP